MNNLVKNVIGMGDMSDQIIAADFLVSAKSGIQNYAVAITETTSPHVRAILRSQLNDAIMTHDAISDFMMKKGFYHAYDMDEQYKVDMMHIGAALTIAENKE